MFPSSALAAVPSVKNKRKARGCLGFDDNLVCIISDLHVRPGHYQEEYFLQTVEDILALRPRPVNVLCLGDVAYLTGKPEEYAAVKQGIKRLENAGMHVTMAMGNHDRRANFAEAFPEKAAASELPHRLVFTVQTPRADFILMDSLQEGDDHDKWIVEGAIDEQQKAWLESKLSNYRDKPVFVMSHHPINETKLTKLLMACPACCGYIYGHNHKWEPGWSHVNYRDHDVLRTLCVPSTGHWGDIGYVLLRLEEDRATASFEQREFFFPTPVKEGEIRPAIWDDIERDHQNGVCTFLF